MIPTGTTPSFNPRSTHLDAAAALVSQEAEYGSTNASSEPKEEERGVRLDDFAVGLGFVPVLDSAEPHALDRSAAAV